MTLELGVTFLIIPPYIPVGLQDAFKRLGGDLELLQGIARIYIEDHSQILLDLERSLQADQASNAERLAHSLKGLVANFDKTELVACCALAEKHLHAGELAEARALFPQMQEGARRLSAELEDFLRKREVMAAAGQEKGD